MLTIPSGKFWGEFWISFGFGASNKIWKVWGEFWISSVLCASKKMSVKPTVPTEVARMARRWDLLSLQALSSYLTVSALFGEDYDVHHHGDDDAAAFSSWRMKKTVMMKMMKMTRMVTSMTADGTRAQRTWIRGRISAGIPSLPAPSHPPSAGDSGRKPVLRKRGPHVELPKFCGSHALYTLAQGMVKHIFYAHIDICIFTATAATAAAAATACPRILCFIAQRSNRSVGPQTLNSNGFTP